MPEPRRMRELDSHLPAITREGESSRAAEMRRRQRHGQLGRVAVEVRNGLPFRPYIYRGLGYDQHGGDDED